MKRLTLWVATAIVLLANGVALFHAWRNRSGGVESELTLTERELPLVNRPSEEDSEVALRLNWSDGAGSWLDAEVLRAAGFDTSVAASAADAPEFYRRQRPRRVFLALEYNGPAWRHHLEQTAAEPEKGLATDPEVTTTPT